jgi:Transposase zinc-ribbon domain
MAPDEGEAYRYLERLRWGGVPESCPRCGVTGRCHFLSPRDGRSRRTGRRARSERRVWKCGACRRQFSVLTGTVLQGTRVRTQAWIRAVEARAASTEGGAADRYGLSREAARHVERVLDAALAAEPVRSGLADDPDPAGMPMSVEGARLLAALLRIDPAVAARLRDALPPRRRPRAQAGPVSDWGAER